MEAILGFLSVFNFDAISGMLDDTVESKLEPVNKFKSILAILSYITK